MKKKNTKKIRKDSSIVKEIKIGCSVMDNEGPSAYINLAKKPKK